MQDLHGIRNVPANAAVNRDHRHHAAASRGPTVQSQHDEHPAHLQQVAGSRSSPPCWLQAADVRLHASLAELASKNCSTSHASSRYMAKACCPEIQICDHRIFTSKLAEPPANLTVMGVEDPHFTSLCRLAKESRGALPRQVLGSSGPVRLIWSYHA